MTIHPANSKNNICHAYYIERDRIEQKYSFDIFVLNHKVFFTTKKGDKITEISNEEALREFKILLLQIEMDYDVKVELGELSLQVHHPQLGVFEL